MSWSLLLLAVLLTVLVLEAPKLMKLRSPRDSAAFYGLWGIAFAAVWVDMAGFTWFRPLNWIRTIVHIIGI